MLSRPRSHQPGPRAEILPDAQKQRDCELTLLGLLPAPGLTLTSVLSGEDLPPAQFPAVLEVKFPVALSVT